MKNFFTIIAGIIAILAGLNLSLTRAVADNSIVAMIANGMGWYFVAKGIFILTHAKISFDGESDK